MHVQLLGARLLQRFAAALVSGALDRALVHECARGLVLATAQGWRPLLETLDATAKAPIRVAAGPLRAQTSENVCVCAPIGDRVVSRIADTANSEDVGLNPVRGRHPLSCVELLRATEQGISSRPPDLQFLCRQGGTKRA